MEKKREPGQHYAVKSPSRGGARPGSGRPRGSTNKITMEHLLASIDSKLGQSYAEQIATNYLSAIERKDWSGVRDYDKVLLGKIVADKLEVENRDADDTVAARAAAFAQAIADLTKVK